MDAEGFIRGLASTPGNGEVTVAAEDGAVVVRLKVPRPAWFRVWMGFAVVLAPVALGMAMFALAYATAREAGEWTPLSILELIAAGGAGLLAFVALILLAAWGLVKTDLTARDDAFTGLSPQWLWRVPREEIRAVRLVHRPKLSLGVDSSAPLRRFVRWAPGAWVDLVTPGGTLRMLSGWDGDTPAYVADVLAKALNVRLEVVEKDQAKLTGADRATASADCTGTRGVRLLRVATIALTLAAPVGGYLIWSEVDAGADWPTVPGAVFQIDKHPREKSHRLEYTYVVDGVRYNSTTVEFSNPAVQHLMDTGRVGTPVEVHYNPQNPAEAALMPGGSPVILLILILGFMEVMCVWLVVQAFRDTPTSATDAMIARYRSSPPPKPRKELDKPRRPRKPGPPSWRVGLVATVASLVTGVVMYYLTLNAWRAGKHMSFESEDEIAPVFVKATLMAVGFSMLHFVLAILEWRIKRKARKESE